MADPPTPRLHIDPPMGQWRVTPRSGRTAPVIATGHQPTLWHPGILAKDLALGVFTQHNACSMIHVVVDHNPIGPLTLAIPARQNDELFSRRLRLQQISQAEPLPPNRLPPIPTSAIERVLNEVQGDTSGFIRDGLARIVRAYRQTGGKPSLATQATSVLGRLKSPHLGQHQGAWSTSQVLTLHFLDRLLADPVACVRCYNRATIAYPGAGIRPLYAGRDVVEVPLWAQDATTCTPVYIDLGDSRRPQLFTTAHNAHLDLTGDNAVAYLRPRAVTLSAVMRSQHCDLFVHGAGGGVYDQVTERWWQDWTGEDLAPKAVVSADVYLPFDVPVATQAQRAHAQWLSHHLPHNLDRLVDSRDSAEARLRREKRALLDHMHDDRDKRRRSKAFKRIHAINAELRSRHTRALEEAARRLQDARVGVRNAAIASRRDWFFALYPDTQLQALRQQIAATVRPA